MGDGKGTHIRIAIGQKGERYVSAEDIREWLRQPDNLNHVAELMAKWSGEGHCPVEVLHKAMLFPIWLAEQKLDEALAAARKQAELN